MLRDLCEIRLPNRLETGFDGDEMSAGENWYYERNHDRVGPLSGRKMQELHALGEIASGTLVWREGFADWRPYAATELSPAAAAGPPPVPVSATMPPPVPSSFQPFVPRTARLRPAFRPSIRGAYGAAWEAMKRRFWPLVGCYALTSLMLGVAGQLYFPLLFLIYPLMGGLYWYILTHLRGKTPDLEMLFEGFRRQFGPLAILNLVVSGVSILYLVVILAVLGGGYVALTAGEVFEETLSPAAIAGWVTGGLAVTFAMFLPLAVFGMVANFAMLLILDCEAPVKRALSLGWEATRPHLLKLTLFLVVNALLSLLGVLALYFGMFITCTWATIALVQLYEDAFGDEASDRQAG